MMNTEREYTKDIEFHAKRVDARERVREFGKKKRRAIYTAAVAFIAASAALGYFVLDFYDRMLPFAAAGVVLAILLTSIAAYCIAGAVIFGGLKKFLRLSSLSSKWSAAAKNMEKLEEKSFDRTAYAGDVEKAERLLSELSEAILFEAG